MRRLWISVFLSCAVSVLASQMMDWLLAVRIPVLGSFAGLERSYNPGIAFGIRLPAQFQTIFIITALVLVSVVAVQTIQKAASYQLSAISFGLILGGGIANVIDRIPDGLVTDFIQVGTFPTFNVADSCITIGVVLLFMEMIVQRKIRSLGGARAN